MTHAAQLDAAETNETRIHANFRRVLPPLNHPPSANMAGTMQVSGFGSLVATHLEMPHNASHSSKRLLQRASLTARSPGFKTYQPYLL